MAKQKLITCHTCKKSTPIARSVRLRPDPFPERERYRARFPDPNNLTPQQEKEFIEAYGQYRRNTEYKQAFICEACYQNLDSRIGMAHISVQGKLKTFGISGDSRRGRAAVYDYKKWASYQKRKASRADQ